jgi:hypothetical protein
MTDFTYAVDADSVAVITWDVPGKSMNVLTREAFALVESYLDRALADPAVKGIVITSGKDSFAGGMDLNVLASIRDEAGEAPAQALFDFIMEGHRILRKIERLGMDPKSNKGGKPVACAITGTCAGIGTEIALACHRRFMADRPKARIGLPEILVGLFPGAGRHDPLFPDGWRDGGGACASRGQDARSRKGEIGQPDRRGRPSGGPSCDREGVGAERHGRRSREALGPEGLQDAGRRALSPGGLHDLRRRLTRW